MPMNQEENLGPLQYYSTSIPGQCHHRLCTSSQI